MRHGRFIYVLGDIHGDFGELNIFINKMIRNNKTLKSVFPHWKAAGDDLQALIMQCGDFAWFWTGCDSSGKILNRIDFLTGGCVPIYWTGGNHEDWDRLDGLGSGISEVDRGVFFCPFGSVLEISPNVSVLFAGGAESADREWRLEEMAKGCRKIWWEQEGISDADMARLADVKRADWVVSHTAPNAFDIASQMRGHWGFGGNVFEPSRGKLEQVLADFRPKRWFFGHYHHFMRGKIDGCEWECLANLGSGSKACDRIYIEGEDSNDGEKR